MTVSRSLTIATVAALTLVASTTQPSARFGGYCNKPPKPYCIDTPGEFNTEPSFSMCRSEVRSYVKRVDTYVDCLRDEQKAAIDESNKVVDLFNCRAKGSNFCF